MGECDVGRKLPVRLHGVVQMCAIVGRITRRIARNNIMAQEENAFDSRSDTPQEFQEFRGLHRRPKHPHNFNVFVRLCVKACISAARHPRTGEPTTKNLDKSIEIIATIKIEIVLRACFPSCVSCRLPRSTMPRRVASRKNTANDNRADESKSMNSCESTKELGKSIDVFESFSSWRLFENCSIFSRRKSWLKTFLCRSQSDFIIFISSIDSFFQVVQLRRVRTVNQYDRRVRRSERISDMPGSKFIAYKYYIPQALNYLIYNSQLYLHTYMLCVSVCGLSYVVKGSWICIDIMLEIYL